MLLDNIQTNATGRNRTVSDAGGRDRRASAWLEARLKRGQKERFAEIVEVTPQMAERILSLNEGPEFRNRSLSANRVRKYADVMARGLWILSAQGISISKTGRLIDGQHRSSAVIEYGQPVLMTVWFGCDDAEFAVVDQGSARTAGDLMHIDGKKYATLRAAVAHVDLRMHEQSDKAYGASCVRAHEDLMHQEALEEACRAAMYRSRLTSPAGMAYAHYLIQMRSEFSWRLPEFWEGFTVGADLSKTSPILKLRDFVTARKGGNGNIVVVRAAAAIILAWNAWVAGKRTANLDWGSRVELPEIA